MVCHAFQAKKLQPRRGQYRFQSEGLTSPFRTSSCDPDSPDSLRVTPPHSGWQKTAAAMAACTGPLSVARALPPVAAVSESRAVCFLQEPPAAAKGQAPDYQRSGPGWYVARMAAWGAAQWPTGPGSQPLSSPHPPPAPQPVARRGEGLLQLPHLRLRTRRAPHVAPQPGG